MARLTSKPPAGRHAIQLPFTECSTDLSSPTAPPAIPVRLTSARAEQVFDLAGRLGVPPRHTALVLYGLVSGYGDPDVRNEWIGWLRLPGSRPEV